MKQGKRLTAVLTAACLCLLGMPGDPALAAAGNAAQGSEAVSAEPAADPEFRSQWLKMNGELYYIQADGTIRTGTFRLGKRTFQTDEKGVLTGVSYNRDDAFYEEDRAYFGGDSLYAANPDGGNRQQLWSENVNREGDPDAVDCVWVENGRIYFYYFGTLYSMNPDGSQQTELKLRGNGIVFEDAEDLCIQDGVIYLTSSDPEYGTGRFAAFDSGGNRLPYPEAVFGGCPDQLQVEDGWMYFLQTEDGLHYGPEACDGFLYRASLTDSRIQQITEEKIDSYFVYGDTAYCMQNGAMIRVSVSSAAAASQEKQNQFWADPEAYYENFAESELRSAYGSSSWAQGGTLSEGILGYAVENIDQEATDELAVVRLKAQNGGYSVVLDVYRMFAGRVVKLGECVLGPASQSGQHGEAKVILGRLGAYWTIQYGWRTWADGQEAFGGISWDFVYGCQFEARYLSHVVEWDDRYIPESAGTEYANSALMEAGEAKTLFQVSW